MADFNKTKSCRHGTLIYSSNDVYVGRSLELYGEFAEGEVELLSQIAQPGDVVMDVGAHIGAQTIVLAKAVGERGAVFAFEPQRIAFQTLCGNMALNSITNVLCIHSAVGKEAGNINVPVIDQSKPNNSAWLALTPTPAGETVKVVTIDSYQVPRCKLIKVDAAGMELDVLTGAIATIQRLRPFLYVENSQREKEGELTRYIDSLGYDIYPHVTRLFNPKNHAENEKNSFGNLANMKLFCAHKTVKLNAEGMKKLDVRPENALN